MRVHGLEGCASSTRRVFPFVPNGNIYAPMMMVAEQAADLIRGDTPLPPAGPFYRHTRRERIPSRQPVGELLAALGERTPAPASGAATALTGALAAALVELAARFAGDEEVVVRAKALWSRLAELADEDAAAYEAFMAERSEATRVRIIAVPQEVAACADEVAALAELVRGQLRSAVVGDAEAAGELARAAARVARRLAELNA